MNEIATRSNPAPVELVEELSSNEEATSDGLFAQMPRIWAAIEHVRAGGEHAAVWLGNGFSLLAALQKLARTSTRLIGHARRAAKENHRVDVDESAELIDAEIIAEFRAQLHELIELFPDAGALFFGANTVDDFFAALFSGATSPAILGAFEELGVFLDARISGFVSRLIEWGFEGGGSGLVAESLKSRRLEEFVRGLEDLLQEVLDRWVLPRIYDQDGDEDDEF